MSDSIQISGFEIIEKLGAGGMAAVWKARQVSLDRIVAIKIMHNQQASDPGDIQRFQSEAQAAAKLKHPGIVQVYDANVENGMYFFVMEYVAGYTVGDWVRRKGPLSEKDVLLVADCVADALEYAWNSAKIIHCDIKPDNVMIDADGTVKVADLGLARTMNAMTISDELTDEILGTPSYISPEQATGVMDLDFRADIYSLGAMMYHLITGKIMFAGETDDRVLELQVSGTVEDPLDINPHITKGMCSVIEKMLAKKREDRYSSWEAVRADLAKVKRKTPFVGAPLPDGASSVRRGRKRSSAGLSTKHPPVGQRSSGPGRVVIWAVAAAVVIISCIVVAVSKKSGGPRYQTYPNDPSVKGGQEQPHSESAEQRSLKLYEAAKAWAEQNPDKHEQIAAKYNEAVSAAPGSRPAMLAMDELRKLNGLKNAAVEKVLTDLKEKADKLAAEKKYAEAADVFNSYSGPYSRETSGKRMVLGGEMSAKQKQLDEALKKEKEDEQKQKEEAEARFNETMDQLVSTIISNGAAAAEASLANFIKDPKMASRMDELEGLRKVLNLAATMDRRIMESFKKGDTIDVDLPVGRKKYLVTGVRDGKVTVREVTEGGGNVERPLEIKDVSLVERLKRMGAETAPDVALSQGLLALQQKSYGAAKKYFLSTHPLISTRLAARMDALENKSASETAKSALAAMVKTLGIATDTFDQKAWIEAIGKRKFTRESEARLTEAVTAYRKQYGRSDFAAEAEPVLAAIEAAVRNGAVDPNPVAVRPAGEPAAGLPPLKPVALPGKIRDAVGDPEKVVTLLIERNADLAAADVILRDQGGKPARLIIASPDVADILPVAALKDLREFVCDRSPRNKLSDISALRGLPLEAVNLSYSSVTDLSSLQGLPIKELILAGTDIAELRSLAGLPLERLNIRGTKVRDISVLKFMKIRELDLSSTKIGDFSVLVTLPLERLDLSNTALRDALFIKDLSMLKELNVGHTKLHDLTPFRALPLTYLNIESTAVRDLSPLKDMKLTTLWISNTDISDLSPVKGMPITALSIAGTGIRDMAALKNLPLKTLNLSGMRIDDLSFLKDSSVENLDISNTRVSDLSQISDLPVRYLNISGSQVRDLRAISSQPLVFLNCTGCNVDLTSLRRSPTLEDIYMDLRPSDDATLRVLRTMPKLRRVNGSPFPFNRPPR